jgi:hypothetical protein
VLPQQQGGKTMASELGKAWLLLVDLLNAPPANNPEYNLSASC